MPTSLRNLHRGRQLPTLASSLYNSATVLPSFPHNNTDDHSQSSRFRALLDATLQDYQSQTCTTLSSHPLAEKLQDCDTVESVTALLREQVRALGDSRGGDGRVMKSLKTVVSSLYTILENSALGEGIGLPVPPATWKAVFTGFAVLLSAVKDMEGGTRMTAQEDRPENPRKRNAETIIDPRVPRRTRRVHIDYEYLNNPFPDEEEVGMLSVANEETFTIIPEDGCNNLNLKEATEFLDWQDREGKINTTYDALLDFLESIEHVMNRLDICTRVPSTGPTTEMIIKIILEMISTLVLVTKQIKQNRPIKPVNKVLGENVVEAVLERLGRLTVDEAQAAAAQTLEVVYGLVQNMKKEMDGEETSVNSIRVILETIQKIANDINRSKRDKLQEDLQRWLSPPDPWKNHNIACRSRHTGTATWFITSKGFSEWKSSGPCSLLWVHGKPGAGKSVLCSSIIEDVDGMRKLGLASLAFFYCDFREDQKKDLHGMLSSLLVQLCHQSDAYCDVLSKLYLEHHGGSRQPNDDALAKCLKEMLRLPRQAPVYIIIDALDECPIISSLSTPRDRVLKVVGELIDLQAPKLRICVTSRPETDIKVALYPLTFHSISLHDAIGQMEDIENYIKSMVNTDRMMRRWCAADKQLVIEVLTRKADGMFRWADCQLGYLRRCFPGRIRRALEELPETLDKTYDRALKDIDEASWELAHRLLQVVAVAARPLRVEELAQFLGFDFATGSIPNFCAAWLLDDPIDAVLSATSSLLAIVDVGGFPVVQFAHFSVKEFLTSPRLAKSNDKNLRRYHISITCAHTLAAQACLSMLLHLDQNITRADLERFPLVEYAAEHWVDHARFEYVSRTVEDGMKRLFDPKKYHFSAWVWIHDLEDQYWRREKRGERPSHPRGTPLHYAALCGLDVVVEFLVIEHSQDLDTRCFDHKSTALHLASRRGHVEVIRVLLVNGADKDIRNNYNSTPLHSASIGGHVAAVHLLLEHGINATLTDDQDFEAFVLAYQGGRSKAARLFLEFGRGMGFLRKHIKEWPPLNRALFEGDIVLTCDLLKRGADLAAPAHDGFIPLQAASLGGHTEAIRVLLEHGVDMTAHNNHERPPLHLASFAGHVEIVRILLEHGADASTTVTDGLTPLHLASFGGHIGVVHILLQHGMDSTDQTDDGWTSLHLASFGGYMGIARLLLEHGADAEARNWEGLTPLHFAAMRGHMEVVCFLLECDVDVTVQDNDGNTPLNYATKSGHVEVSRVLLERSPDAMVRENHI